MARRRAKRAKRKTMTAAKRQRIETLLSLANNALTNAPCTTQKRWIIAAQKKSKTIGNSILARHAKSALRSAKKKYNAGCDTITGKLR